MIAYVDVRIEVEYPSTVKLGDLMALVGNESAYHVSLPADEFKDVQLRDTELVAVSCRENLVNAGTRQVALLHLKIRIHVLYPAQTDKDEVLKRIQADADYSVSLLGDMFEGFDVLDTELVTVTEQEQK